ncbi:MAG: hypothetical protein ABR583_02985 [Gaiellaceae bacterium]
MRPASAALLLGAGAAGVLAARRVRTARREAAELHYDDGSTVVLPGAAVGGERLVSIAREALRATK